METAPFVESKPQEDTPAALRTRMEADGYLFAPQVVDPEAIRQVRHDILDVCARAGWLAPGSDPDEGITAPGVRYLAVTPLPVLLALAAAGGRIEMGMAQPQAHAQSHR